MVRSRIACLGLGLLALATASPRPADAVVSKEVFFAKQPAVFAAPRTLVLTGLSEKEAKKKYGKFLKSLEKRGHVLSFDSIENKGLQVFAYGEKLFENLVLFPGEKGLPGKEEPKPSYKITQEEIKEGLQAAKARNFGLTVLLDFVDQGGNVFLGTSPVKVARDFRKFANECGVDFLKEDSALVDYFNTAPSSSWKEAGSAPIFGLTRSEAEQTVAPAGHKVLFQGLAHSIANSPLNFNVLAGSATAYTLGSKAALGAGDKAAEPLAAGADVHLVSALVARNAARVSFAGSDSLCWDETFEVSKENEKFCENLSKWTFMEKNVLRMSNLTSHKVGEDGITPYMYRITDDITFKIDIEEYSDGKWAPYIGDDVQLEFVMLDPHVRTFLNPPKKGSGSSTYSVTFKSPDVYGVFKFKILYRRLGYNELHVEELAPLRNFKHNDYERFIWCASPYYASCLLSPIAVLMFSLRFLYHREGKGAKALAIE